MMSDFVIENGVLVKYIGQGGDVVIPDGVTEIGTVAFIDCEKLKSVLIPKSVNFIGSWAFERCYKLKQVNIPESITEIPECAFSHCSGLKEITLPKGIKKIGFRAFSNCGLENIEMPDELVEIENNAFEDCPLECIAIPEGVTKIGSGAFNMCSKLREVTLPSTLTSVSYYAFSGCRNLKSVINLSNVSVLNKNILCNPIPEIDSGFFPNEELSKLDSVFKIMATTVFINNQSIYSEEKKKMYQEYLRKQGAKVLLHCTNNKKIEMVKSILEMKCLTPLAIEKSIEATDDIEISAMLLEYRNKNVDIEKENKKKEAKIEKTLSDIDIIKKQWAFKKQEDATLIITNYKGCEKEVIVPEIIGKNVVTVLGKGAISPMGPRCSNFDERNSIEKIVLPNSIHTIEEDCFGYCQSLQTVVLSENLREIPNSAFCYSVLTEIELPRLVESIGVCAFSCCKKLQSVKLPDNLQTIRYHAFDSCKSLKKLTIPVSVKKIEYEAFSECPELVLYVHIGSYAEVYAKENGINFVTI